MATQALPRGQPYWIVGRSNGSCCKKPDSGRRFQQAGNAREVWLSEVLETARFRKVIFRNLKPDACRGSKQQSAARAGQNASMLLLARRAGVHVDFHAHRHFDDFRSLPSHSGSSQLIWRDFHAGAEPRAAPDAAQVRNIDGTHQSAAPDSRYFSLGQS